MSNYLAHAIGVKATHNLPIQSDVMSPKGRYVKNDDCIHIYWMLNGRWSEDTTISKYHRQPNGDYVFDGVSVELFKDTIKRQGNFECNQRNIRALWDDARLTQMARNMLNQAQSALAQISNQLNMRHSAIPEDVDIIDVSDTLQHASRHEGYYSPNYTDKKATPYIYDTLVKSSDGRQIGMRFKGVGDREWVIIYVPSVDFTPTYNNIIKLINDNKDISNRKVVIRENEKAKAARIVTNFFNSPSVAGNEKMTTFVKNPQHLKRSSSVSHALFTEVYDMDEYLEHHGILGMKWGVRRYQNEDGSLTAAGAKRYGVKGDRKGTQNRLNDVDEAMARNKRYVNELSEQEKSIEKKVNKFANSNSSNADAKKDEYERKLDEIKAKKAEYEKNIETGKKEIESLLKEAVDNGYTVSRVDTMRSTVEGKDIVASMLASGVGMAIPALLGLPIGVISVPAASEEGIKYTVKETKEGETARVVDKRSSYFSTGVPRSAKTTVNNSIREREQSQRQQQQNRGMIAMVPAGTLPQETRLSKEEETEFWKELAKYYEKQGNAK